MQSVDATDVPCHISLTADLQIKWECKTQFIWVTVYLNLAITSYTPTPLQRHNYSLLLTTWAPMGPMGGLLNLWWCLSIACNRLVTLNPPKAVTWDKRKHRNGKMNHKFCTGQGIQLFKNAYWITDIDIWNCASSCVKNGPSSSHAYKDLGAKQIISTLLLWFNRRSRMLEPISRFFFSMSAILKHKTIDHSKRMKIYSFNRPSYKTSYKPQIRTAL